MTALVTEHIQPEDLMAFVDGELTGSQAETIASHLAECPACTAEVDTFRSTPRALAAWIVEPVPPCVERGVLGALAGTAPGGGLLYARRKPRLVWWGSGAAAFATLALVVAFAHQHSATTEPREMAKLSEPAPAPADRARVPIKAAPAPPAASMGGLVDESREDKQSAPAMAAMQREVQPPVGGGGFVPPVARPSTVSPSSTPSAAGPMIAREVSLGLTVDNVDHARAGIEAVLTRYAGFAAQMQLSTPGEGARALTASLRIPAPALPAALADLKRLGHVDDETQTGEDVGEQHRDLVARLDNARVEEARLRDILRLHTGTVSDILEVEEQIATVRGEVEQMEGEQQALEHRVTFATVELTVTEKDHAAPAHTIGAQLREAFHAGYRNVGAMLLGIAVFLAADGPMLAVLLVPLAALAVWLYRRYRRARNA